MINYPLPTKNPVWKPAHPGGSFVFAFSCYQFVGSTSLCHLSDWLCQVPGTMDQPNSVWGEVFHEYTLVMEVWAHSLPAIIYSVRNWVILVQILTAPTHKLALLIESSIKYQRDRGYRFVSLGCCFKLPLLALLSWHQEVNGYTQYTEQYTKHKYG